MHKSSLFLLLITFFCLSLFSCENDDYIPKPRGYFRIDFPEKRYTSYLASHCGFGFEVPVYSMVMPDKSNFAEPCWINIDFPIQRGTLHLSYKKVNNDVSKFTEDARSLVYKHTVKAEAIEEEFISYPDKKVYGTIYHIEGNAASSLQFYITDSTTHFIRGALYFNVVPNKDSIAPVAEFINADIYHLLETFQWK